MTAPNRLIHPNSINTLHYILNEMISIKGQTPPLALNLKIGRLLLGLKPDGKDPYPETLIYMNRRSGKSHMAGRNP
nr:hypothetical protein [Clostridia bacterium]